MDELVRLVKENHSYEVPEVVALPISGGNPDYLKYIDEVTSLEWSSPQQPIKALLSSEGDRRAEQEGRQRGEIALFDPLVGPR